MENITGMNAGRTLPLIEGLNDLLANYQLFYANVRGFHWNITGSSFFELHVKFEELYNDALLKIDEIAERIRTLEGTPTHTFSEYIKQSAIRESRGISDGKKAATEIVNGLNILLEKERALLTHASQAGDEGTNALMSDYIRQQEKLMWMYRAYLK
jgi:starvation-inducible DNA-binding protein